MPARKTGSATATRTRTTRARTSPAMNNLMPTSGGGQFKHLNIDVGPYGLFWVNNKQLEIFKMQGGQLISIRNQTDCTDLWNVLELHLQSEKKIPVISGRARAVSGGQTVGRVRATAAHVGGTNSTTRRTRTRRTPVSSAAVGAA